MCYSEEDGAAIPAANTGDIDLLALARTHPAEAAEIARLEALMNHGGESNGEFLRLCQLVRDFGSSQDAEYLLRRNIDGDFKETDIETYFELFGEAKWDEYQRSIETFQNQFHVLLTETNGADFMITEFETEGSELGGGQCGLLSEACVVEISYDHKDFITAIVDVPGINDLEEVWVVDEREAMVFIDGAWKIVSMDDID